MNYLYLQCIEDPHQANPYRPHLCLIRNMHQHGEKEGHRLARACLRNALFDTRKISGNDQYTGDMGAVCMGGVFPTSPHLNRTYQHVPPHLPARPSTLTSPYPSDPHLQARSSTLTSTSLPERAAGSA